MAAPRLRPMIALRFAPALIAALALSACIGPDLDSVGDYGAGLSPFATASVPERPLPVQVFIASTRRGETGEAARQQAAEAHYALATMTVPPGHRAGAIEEPLWGRPNGRNDITLAGERELDDDEFRAELASHISGRVGVNRDALVFVHGFNTSFDEARLRATQIAADAHFGGVMVLFTWPSKSDVFGYVSDKDSATASRDALQGLLHDLGADARRRQGPHPRAFDGRVAQHGGSARLGHRRRQGPLRPSGSGHSRFARHRHDGVRLADGPRPAGRGHGVRDPQRPGAVAVELHRSSRQRVGAIDASKPEDRAEIEVSGARVVDITAYSDADRFISHAVYRQFARGDRRNRRPDRRAASRRGQDGVDARRDEICRPEPRARAGHRRARLAGGDGGSGRAARAGGGGSRATRTRRSPARGMVYGPRA